jgi:hypothetical protein
LPDLEIAAPPSSACGDGYIDPDAGETCDPGDAGRSSPSCPLCRMTCVNGAQTSFLDPASNHCYFVVPGDQSLSIDASAEACEAAGAHLVRIVSDQEMATVAKGSSFDGYWIGLRKALFSPQYPPDEPTIEPGWASTCPGCYARIEDASAGVDCLTGSKTADAAWSHTACTTLKNPGKVTLCEQEPPGHRTAPCMGDKVCFSVAATLGGPPRAKRYVFVPSVLGYADAVSACASVGASVVAFDSREEREQVVAEVEPMAHDFWVALVLDQGHWGWDSALDAGEVWGDGEPVPGNGPHAYVRIEKGAVDSALVHAAGTEPHYVVCQF